MNRPTCCIEGYRHPTRFTGNFIFRQDNTVVGGAEFWADRCPVHAESKATEAMRQEMLWQFVSSGGVPRRHG